MCEPITMAGSNFLKWNIEKGTTLTASRRMPLPREEVFWQIPTAGTDKMTNARPIPGGGGDGTLDWLSHYYSVFPPTITFTLLASPWWLLAFSYFVTADIKFSYCFSSEIRLLCFFISRFSSFSVIHVSVDKNLAEKRLDFVVYLTLKVRVARVFALQPRVTIGSPYLLIQLFYSEWGISAFCVLVPCFLHNEIILLSGKPLPTKRKIGKDIQEIERGKCACGECDDFMRSDGATCGCCGCCGCFFILKKMTAPPLTLFRDIRKTAHLMREQVEG